MPHSLVKSIFSPKFSKCIYDHATKMAAIKIIDFLISLDIKIKDFQEMYTLLQAHEESGTLKMRLEIRWILKKFHFVQCE